MPAGSISSILAYRVKKAYTFTKVPKNLEAVSRMPSSSNRVGTHGGDTASRYHLKVSLPYLSIIIHGSTALPRDLDIFCPCLSRIKSLTNTCLNAGSPNNNVDMAKRE